MRLVQPSGRRATRFGARDDPAQRPDELDRVALLDEPLEHRELLAQPGRRRPAAARCARSSGAGSPTTTSPSPTSTSCSFSPGAGPIELDRDLAPRLLAREPDHVLGEVDDLHRLAHVEHVDLAALGDRARLDDELHRLRDRHEEARHLGVRHRRPARPARSGGGRSGSPSPTSRARCRSARRRSASATSARWP